MLKLGLNRTEGNGAAQMQSSISGDHGGPRARDSKICHVPLMDGNEVPSKGYITTEFTHGYEELEWKSLV